MTGEEHATPRSPSRSGSLHLMSNTQSAKRLKCSPLSLGDLDPLLFRLFSSTVYARASAFAPGSHRAVGEGTKGGFEFLQLLMRDLRHEVVSQYSATPD